MNIVAFNYDEEYIDDFISKQSNLSESMRALIKSYIEENGITEVIKDRGYTTKEYQEIIKGIISIDKEFSLKDINEISNNKLKEKLDRALTDEELRLEQSKIRGAIAVLRKDKIIERTGRGLYKRIL